MRDITTRWTVIELAGEGDRVARETFARVYLPVVRRYVSARWEGTSWRAHTEDAVQQVFVECLRPGGAISKVSRDDAWGFRDYLYGVARNVARSVEKQHRNLALSKVPEPAERDHSGLQMLFDRAFAGSLIGEALELQQRQAEDSGHAAQRRLELLRMRFWEGLPIREIAKRWDEEREVLHREYARAREEFRDALRIVLAEHCGQHSKLTEEDLREILASS